MAVNILSTGGGGKVSATLAVNLDAADDEVTVYGSNDGGTTRQVLKTDAGGALQVDIESITAGTNIIGKVGIDQTTPGTTNGVSVIVPSAATDTWDADDSTANEASSISKASAGICRGLTGYNSKTTAQWIQLHNSATLPTDAAVPVISQKIAPLDNFFIDFGEKGKWFSTGIVWCNSSTQATKTIGAADCWVNLQYK